MPTYRCTAACKHCGTLSSPKEDTWLPVDDMLRAIDEAASAGYGLVVFTGGEPTLAGEHLLLGIRRAASHGVVVRMVTNGWWAESVEAAGEAMRTWVEAGLNELNVSTGDQHHRFVPVESVVRAIQAGVEHDLTVAVMIEVVDGRDISRDTVESHPLYEAMLDRRPEARVSFHESPWMPLSPTRTYEYPNGQAANRQNLASRTGCDSILTTTTVQADGRIAACCGLGMRNIPELQLGMIGSTSITEADERAADDFLKRWIQIEGPEKILAWAAELDASIEWEDMYAHRCQACIRIYKDPKVRKVITEQHLNKLADVCFQEWMMFHFDAARGAAEPE
ncbi:MAG TPA: radical SAM protein [Solirubrobacterales bacterium]|nr:radical SAM protein [Solirubrobacterales bacterium]